MPLFKKKAAKKEAAKDQKKDSKSDDMAMAYGAMRRKKMSKSGKPCSGETCQGCEDKACFAFGGHVGVHGRAAEISGHTYDRERRGKGHNLGGISNAGERIRNANRYGSDMPESKKLSTEDAKDLHREKLEEIKGMKKPNLYAQGGSPVCSGETCQGCEDKACFAQGGSIKSHRGIESGHEKGINKRRDPYVGTGGTSQAGYDTRSGTGWARRSEDEGKKSIGNQLAKESLTAAKDKHKEVLSEMKGMKKPNLYAQGGSVVDRIRRMMAEGGYVFDDQDQIEHSNYYDELNEDLANEPLYEDDYGTDPTDSNEHGDSLSDADENGKSLFKKIKMKKAQKGDRGNY